MDALSIANLDAYYGKAHVLQGISLAVRKGEVTGLFGRNGAGKTTLLKAIMRLGPRTEGEVLLLGRPLSKLRADARARAGLSYMPQDPRVFTDLSVEENCRVAAQAAASPRALDEIIAWLPELAPLMKQTAGSLSGGQQQIVGFARSLVMNCEVLLMDEPTEGLMPLLIDRIGGIISEIAAQGVGVLLVEQNMALGLSACSRIYFLEKGRIAGYGSPQEVKERAMFERYLGIGGARVTALQ